MANHAYSRSDAVKDLRRVGAYLIAHADDLVGWQKNVFSTNDVRFSFSIGPDSVPEVTVGRDYIVAE